MKAAQLRATSMQLSVESLSMAAAADKLEAQVTEMRAELNRLQKERAARLHAVKTETELAEEAERYYALMSKTLASIVAEPTPVATAME